MPSLEERIKAEARRLGFILAGITTPEPPAHFEQFERWLQAGYHGEMAYLASERSRERRADPRRILPECRSILVLAMPYAASRPPEEAHPARGQIASYAWGEDYHLTLEPLLKAMVAFLEAEVGHPFAYRAYTDSGPLLERELAQRAGLGWIGKNSCLIHPRYGSYFLLAEILLELELTPDSPFPTDHCGRCTRCLQACPTQCILPDRTLDARRCISYLTIENKGAIPPELRPALGNWIFGCDECQRVCPWNRFASDAGHPAFAPQAPLPHPPLRDELRLSPEDFRSRFRRSPVKRAKHRGYLRNVAVALGNSGTSADLPVLEEALERETDPLVQEHLRWAIQRLRQGVVGTRHAVSQLTDAPNQRARPTRHMPCPEMPLLLLATGNPGKRLEFQALLSALPCRLLIPAEIGLALEVAEEGASYAENALHKALTYARASGLLTLADDSGLEVDALGGAPGIHSARYHSHPGASDAERRARLLANLQPYPRPWRARFRAVLALADPQGRTHLAEGLCEGEIIPEERGKNGFGYDPIFLVEGLGRTMAELTLEEKNRLSHRARAFQALRPTLERWLGQS